MSDIIDRIMQEQADHVSWLKECFAEMKKAGFENIRIAERDLRRYSVENDGVDKVIREMFQLDGGVTLRAYWHCPRRSGDEPYRVSLLFILCNNAWESLADHTIPCDSVDKALSDIVNRLAERYEK